MSKTDRRVFEVNYMLFVTLVKFRKKPTKEMITQNLSFAEMEAKKEGIKNIATYWTIGRYDAVVITDSPNEETHMRSVMRRGEFLSSESLVAIPAEEARKLVE
jgi:uncharacterized protein with GYD domain